MPSKLGLQILWLSFLLLWSCTGCFSGSLLNIPIIRTMTSSSPERPSSLVAVPEQITSYPADAISPAISPDGNRLLFVSDRSGNLDIWLKNLDVSASSVPIQLTDDTATDTSPAWSPDGKRIVFVSHRSDPNGDIYILDLPSRLTGDPAEFKLTRLTDLATADSNPIWHPDGQSIVYSVRSSSDRVANLWRLNLADHNRRPLTHGGGINAAFSPDGKLLSFVIPTDTQSHLWILDLTSDTSQQLTQGAVLDTFSSWSDGQSLFFSRFSEDTNRDNKVTIEDRPCIWRVELHRSATHPNVIETKPPVQLTSSRFFSLSPAAAADKLYFVSNRLGHVGIWALPLGGLISKQETLAGQWAVAETVEHNAIDDIHLTLLAYQRVLQHNSDSKDELLAKALYKTTLLYQRLGQVHDAERFLIELQDRFPQSRLYAGLAAVDLIRLRSTTSRQHLPKMIDKLNTIRQAFNKQSRVGAAALLLLGELSTRLQEPQQALQYFDRIKTEHPSERRYIAEAIFRKAKIYQLFQDIENVLNTYLTVVRGYPDVKEWPIKAANAAVSLLLGNLQGDQAIARLRSLADTYQSTPYLAAIVLQRVGDLHYERAEVEYAKEAYETLVERFVDHPQIVIEASLSLAHIAEDAADYKQALFIYSELLQNYDKNPIDRRRIRRDYIKIAKLKAEQERRQQDPRLALKTYLQLVQFAPLYAPAHRGVVELYAQLGEIERAEQRYLQMLEEKPDRAVVHYALGLSYTYFTPPKLNRAEQLLHHARLLDPQSEHIHQAVGFVKEQLGRRQNDTTLLELALSAYQTALELNKRGTDRRNRANLLLNMGNAFFALKNFQMAVNFYQQRAALDVEFLNPTRELLYTTHYGIAAFRIGESSLSQRHLRQAIKLAGKAQNAILQAQLWDRLGLSLQDGGKYEKAIDAFSRALDLHRQQGRLQLAYLSLRNLANNRFYLAKSQGDSIGPDLMLKSLETYFSSLERVKNYTFSSGVTQSNGSGLLSITKTLSLAADGSQAIRGFDRDGEMKLLFTNIGRIYETFGEYEKAHQFFQQKLGLIAPQSGMPEAIPSQTEKALLLNQMGFLSFQTGELLRALKEFEASLALCKTLDNRACQIINHANIALIMTEADHILSDAFEKASMLNDALAGLDEGIELLIDAPITTHTLDALILRNLAGTLAFKLASIEHPKSPGNSPTSVVKNTWRDWQQSWTNAHRALHYFNTALNDLKLVSDREAKRSDNVARHAVILFHNLSHVWEFLGQEKEAQAALHHALALANKFYLHDMLWKIRLAMAELSSDDSRSLLLQAVGDLEKAPPSLTLAPYDASTISLLERLYKRIIAHFSDRAEMAFLYGESLVEQRRLAIMQQSFLSKLNFINRDAQAQHQKLRLSLMKLRQLQQKLASPERVALFLSSMDNSVPFVETTQQPKKLLDEEEAELRTAFNQVLQHYDDELKDVQNGHPKLASLFLPAKINPGEIQQLISSDTVVLKYIMLSGHMAIWAIQQNGFHMITVEVPSDQMRSIANRLITESQTKQDLEHLSEWLIKPLAATIESRTRLYIIPDPSMISLPWAGLQLNGQTLGINKQISLIESTNHFYHAWQQRSLFHQRFLAVQDCKNDHPNNGSNNDDQCFPVRMGRWTWLNPKKNSKDEFFAEAAVHDVISIDLPLKVHSVNPSQSAWHTTLGLQHGWIDLPRFYNLDTQAGLVVLANLQVSPAETGKFYPILNHALTFAGFSTVVVHEGPPDISSHQSFMKIFYQALSVQAVGEAFRLAQREVRNLKPDDNGWMKYHLFGHLGMNASERQEFARVRYKTALRHAVQALKRQEWATTASALERLIRLASILNKDKVLPVLYQRLSEAYRHQKRYDNAIHAQLQLLKLAQSKKIDALMAKAHYALGILYSDTEQFAAAVQHLQRSVELHQAAGRWQALSRSYVTLGIAQELGADYEDALKSFQYSLGISEQLNAPHDVGRQLRRLGRIYMLRLNNYAAAKEQFEQALDIFTNRQDLDQVMWVKLEIGRVYQHQGDFATALDYFNQAAQHASDSSDPSVLAQVHIDLANTFWLQGEYQDAFLHQREAERLANQADAKLQQLLATNTLGLIYWTLNNYERARKLQKKALQLAKDFGLKHELATILNNTGIIDRQQGKYDAAIEAFQKALEIDTGLKSHWGRAYDHRNLGMTFLAKGEYTTALVHLTEAIQLSQSIGDLTNTAKAIMSRADTFLATGNEAKAAKSYDQSLRIARKIGLQEVIWRTLYGLGRLNRAAQRFSLAAKNFQESIKIIESMRAAIKVEEFRNGFLSDKMDVYEALIFLLLKQGEIGAAYDFSERARARSFIDLLGNQRISLKSAVSNELLALFRTEQNRLYQLRQAWAASSPAKRTTLHAAVKAQAQKVQEILADIKSNDPQLSTFVNVEPLSLSQVQALLAPEVKLLEYFVGKHATVVWGLSRDQLAVRIVPITRDELSAKVHTYRDLLSNLQPVEAITRSLYELLLQPIASFFTPSRYLGIIPHGVLHYIPFAAFHNGEQFLVDNHAIFYAPSASVLRFTFNKRKNGRHNKAVLAIGNPDLGELNYDLPLAEKEVESLQWPFPDITILTRDKALESWVVQNIEKYDIVHIASHGEFDPINPLFSALKLARDFQADGNLEVGEIFGLNVQADLVTLSACQTGLGTLLNGDELIGLNRAFLYAGTHALIASLWRIDDLASAVLMKHFYRFYQDHTKAEALRQAQLTVRQQFPHPAHWAGFVLSGDYQ